MGEQSLARGLEVCFFIVQSGVNGRRQRKTSRGNFLGERCPGRVGARCALEVDVGSFGGEVEVLGALEFFLLLFFFLE